MKTQIHNNCQKMRSEIPKFSKSQGIRKLKESSSFQEEELSNLNTLEVPNEFSPAKTSSNIGNKSQNNKQLKHLYTTQCNFDKPTFTNFQQRMQSTSELAGTIKEIFVDNQEQSHGSFYNLQQLQQEMERIKAIQSGQSQFNHDTREFLHKMQCDIKQKIKDSPQYGKQQNSLNLIKQYQILKNDSPSPLLHRNPFTFQHNLNQNIKSFSERKSSSSHYQTKYVNLKNQKNQRDQFNNKMKRFVNSIDNFQLQNISEKSNIISNLNEFHEKVALKYKKINENQLNTLKLIPIKANSNFDSTRVSRRFRITDNDMTNYVYKPKSKAE